jgi:hypothetical protein
MKADKIIDKLEDLDPKLDRSQKIRLLMLAFEMKYITTLELMALEKLLKEFSV